MQLLGALLDEFQVLADIERQKRQAKTEADLDLILRERRRRRGAKRGEHRKPKHKSAQSFHSSSEGGDYSSPSPAGGGSTRSVGVGMCQRQLGPTPAAADPPPCGRAIAYGAAYRRGRVRPILRA